MALIHGVAIIAITAASFGAAGFSIFNNYRKHLLKMQILALEHSINLRRAGYDAPSIR